jgi:uncharacterized protein (UPF0262 family)
MTGSDSPTATGRLIGVHLDADLRSSASADIEHERKVAIFDLVAENSFKPVKPATGPFHLRLSTDAGRLIFDIRDEQQAPCCVVGLSISPFRRIVKDYFLICESYHAAIKTATPSQIETIDMARRGLHNEGSELLMQRLKGKIELDFDTARRLFTLVCALHWRG